MKLLATIVSIYCRVPSHKRKFTSCSHLEAASQKLGQLTPFNHGSNPYNPNYVSMAKDLVRATEKLAHVSCLLFIHKRHPMSENAACPECFYCIPERFYVGCGIMRACVPMYEVVLWCWTVKWFG
jgi:hypothetical protein